MAVAGLRPEPSGCGEVVSVPTVSRAALCFNDSFEDMGGGTPPLFGCLSDVAGGEFSSGLLLKTLAGRLMLLGGRLGIPLLLPQVSNLSVLRLLYGRGACTVALDLSSQISSERRAETTWIGVR